MHVWANPRSSSPCERRVKAPEFSPRDVAPTRRLPTYIPRVWLMFHSFGEDVNRCVRSKFFQPSVFCVDRSTNYHTCPQCSSMLLYSRLVLTLMIIGVKSYQIPPHYCCVRLIISKEFIYESRKDETMTPDTHKESPDLTLWARFTIRLCYQTLSEA